MVRSESHPGQLILASEARRQAGRLLQRLMADRILCEQRLAEAGRDDPLKSLTGVSSLDRAVDSARNLLSQIDALVGELERSGAPAPRGAATAPSSGGCEISVMGLSRTRANANGGSGRSADPAASSAGEAMVVSR